MASTKVPSRRAIAAAALGSLAVAGSGAYLVGLAGPQPARAWVGDSFASIPGIVGGGDKGYGGWLRIEAHYWKSLDIGGFTGSARHRPQRTALFGGPPMANGARDTLVIAVDKRKRALPALMAACAKRATLPEVRFAESSHIERNLFEFGPRPKTVPEFYEYRLKDVTVVGCPVLKEAPQQGIELGVRRIEWANYDGPSEGQPVVLTPAMFDPAPTTGETRTFVVHWLGEANDVSDDQCLTLNGKPPEDAYFALMSKSEADRERAELAGKGGPGYENGQMGRRGPGKLNICFLPGLVPDPGFAEPRSEIARGLDLDGDRGTGKIPANTCKHATYRSDDGRAGIDNQLFRVEGCIPGYRGHKGFMLQYFNEDRRNGTLSILVEIAGIDDPRNDDSVQVSLLYSKDPMAKDGAGGVILSDYTFRLSDSPRFQHYFTRLKGRIIDGTIVTEQVPLIQLRHTDTGERSLHNAGMRLRILPDGTLKGVLGGYEDWRKILVTNSHSGFELLQGYTCPGLYYAFKRHADGLKDPVTGECHGISMAYDIEGIPAFVAPQRQPSQTAKLKR